MKLLVTGSEGYIGTVLVPMLVERGHDVRRLDSMLFETCALDAMPLGPVVRNDVRDLVVDDFLGVETVLHLAGLSNDPLGDLDPAVTYDINRDATIRLARLARQAGVRRFVFSSTCSVYGAQGHRWLDESSRLKPLTPYAVSKMEAEQAISALATDSFEVVHLRHGTAYGYSPMLRFDLVANNLLAWALADGRIHLKSDGLAWRPLVHVEDIARAFVAATEADSGAVAGETFNIGRNEDNIRVIDLAGMIARLLPDCALDVAADAGRDQRSYRVDCRKASAKLPGFDPHWRLREGLGDLIARLRRYPLKVDEIEGVRFSRIAALRAFRINGRVDDEFRLQDASFHPGAAVA